MKALTLYQPWATLVALGAKKIETRSWDTKYRGPLAIHAAKATPVSWREFANDTFREVLEPLVGVNEYGAPRIDLLPHGCVLAFATLTDVLTTREALATRVIEGTPEESFGDFSHGRFAWMLTGVRPLRAPYYAYRGAQRLWNLPDVDVLLASNLIAVSSPITREEAERAWA